MSRLIVATALMFCGLLTLAVPGAYARTRPEPAPMIP